MFARLRRTWKLNPSRRSMTSRLRFDCLEERTVLDGTGLTAAPLVSLSLAVNTQPPLVASPDVMTFPPVTVNSDAPQLVISEVSTTRIQVPNTEKSPRVPTDNLPTDNPVVVIRTTVPQQIPDQPRQPIPTVQQELPPSITNQALAIALAISRPVESVGGQPLVVVEKVEPRVETPNSATRPVIAETLTRGGSGTTAVGEISGRVFVDMNGNGIQEPGEEGVAGQLVYLDMNGNGRLDPDEPWGVTDHKGDYVFTGLKLDRHHVAQNLQLINLKQTLPENNRAHEVTLTADVPHRTNVNFSTQPYVAMASGETAMVAEPASGNVAASNQAPPPNSE